VSLDVAGQWATVLSPLVATSVFVFTVWFEHRRRTRERYSVALDAARADVIRAIHWAGLPGWTHIMAGIGIVRSFNSLSSFVLCLPDRQGAIGLWLVQGTTNMTTANHSRDRRIAQSQMLTLLVLLTPGNRRAFKAAAAFIERNQWSEVETGTPVAVKRAIKPVYALLRLAFGDPTYGAAGHADARETRAD